MVIGYISRTKEQKLMEILFELKENFDEMSNIAGSYKVASYWAGKGLIVGKIIRELEELGIK